MVCTFRLHSSQIPASGIQICHRPFITFHIQDKTKEIMIFHVEEFNAIFTPLAGNPRCAVCVRARPALKLKVNSRMPAVRRSRLRPARAAVAGNYRYVCRRGWVAVRPGNSSSFSIHRMGCPNFNTCTLYNYQHGFDFS